MITSDQLKQVHEHVKAIEKLGFQVLLDMSKVELPKSVDESSKMTPKVRAHLSHAQKKYWAEVNQISNDQNVSISEARKIRKARKQLQQS